MCFQNKVQLISFHDLYITYVTDVTQANKIKAMTHYEQKKTKNKKQKQTKKKPANWLSYIICNFGVKINVCRSNIK